MQIIQIGLVRFACATAVATPLNLNVEGLHFVGG